MNEMRIETVPERASKRREYVRKKVALNAVSAIGGIFALLFGVIALLVLVGRPASVMSEFRHRTPGMAGRRVQ